MADSDYTTKGSFNLGNQIALKNKNSNIDRDYGPYEGKTLTEIATLLTDTIQIGKTIGVIEDGTVVEYWWQPVGEGKYGFVIKTNTPIVNHQTASKVTIQPNAMNVWEEEITSSVTITKGGSNTDTVNHYMIRYTAGDGGQIIFDTSWGSLKWYGGDKPEWVIGYTYEISIVDNIALWVEIEG